MKIFLSSLENVTCGKVNNSKPLVSFLAERKIPMKYILMSYYYIQGGRLEIAEYIRDHAELVIIDSGAHTLQKGRKVDWEAYTRNYAEFIKKFDRPNVVGYFEMDVDGIIGYEKVLELRRILENVSDKIIPVWHDGRGVADFIEMCKKYSGKTVAISGFSGMDIQDHQYIMFVKEAKKYNCKIHCLGMTRKKILDKVPFDYTDSSTWVQSHIFGVIKGQGKVTREFSRLHPETVLIENFKEGLKMQEHYYQKWRKVCKD